jgi:ribonuclease HI
MDGINIVGFVYGAEGRSPDNAKVIKILEWKPCSDIGEARAFIGVCVYYRIWIKGFSIVAKPIYHLFKKGVPWNWGLEQDLAMSALKTALTSAPALVKIIYDGGEIILAVDASLKGWGVVLMQLDALGKRHPSRYESGLWNQAERNYDATKRECRAVLKALRKVRYWLYGVQFILETDANVLVAQLNRSATDLPGALVTRWIAYIRLFDFVVRHVPGNKHTAADGLSQRPRTESDDIDEANEGLDIDDFIDAEINAF